MREPLKNWIARHGLSQITNCAKTIRHAFPILSTKRLLLRQLTYADAADLLAYLSNKEVTKHYDLAQLHSLQDAEHLIHYWNNTYKQHSAIRWAITLKSHNGKVIGTCGLHNFCLEHYRGDIGYDLHPHVWQQGYMTEALIAVQEYAFRKLKLHRLEAFTLSENIASRALLLKTGLHYEGLLRDYFWNKGSYKNTEVFSILLADWKNDRKRKKITDQAKKSTQHQPCATQD